MKLKYRSLEFLQTLDYENLPFRCHRYHNYGHLAWECPLGHRRHRRQKRRGKNLEVNQWLHNQKEGTLLEESGLQAEAQGSDPEQVKEAAQEQLGFLASGSVSTPMSRMGTAAVSEMVGVALASPPQYPPFSICSSFDVSQSCCEEPGPLRQLMDDLSILRQGLDTSDSVIMTIPPSPKLPSSSTDAALHFPPRVWSPEPPYNLRSLASRKGKGIIVGGLDVDMVSTEPRKTRGRKSNLTKAQLKAVIDIAGGK